MLFDSVEASTSFSETFAKKKEMVVHQKTIGKIPQKNTELNA